MKRARQQDLHDLVVRKSDLKMIWSFFSRIAAADQQHGPPSDALLSSPELPTISVSSAGSMSTEAENESIFDNDVIDLQKSLSVEFRYSNYRRNSKSVRVRLVEGGNSFWESGSSFSVSGEDVAWVDATFVELERLFAAVPPQSSMFKRYRIVVTLILGLAIGYSWLKITDLIPYSPSGPPPKWAVYIHDHEPLRIAIFAAVAELSGYVPARATTYWIGKLWPSIEFDFGPEHFKHRKQVRARVVAVIVLLALPFALNAFQRFVLGWK